MSEATEKTNAKGKLITDFKTVISDIEVLLKEASGQLGDKASGLKEKLNEGVQKAKRQLDELESTAKEKGREAMRVTDGFVHDRPWESVGIGFGIGVLVGILLNRR
jgi:ElaB/YqjD/DUF883 family membrane-anchored ribosome-binding protein